MVRCMNASRVWVCHMLSESWCNNVYRRNGRNWTRSVILSLYMLFSRTCLQSAWIADYQICPKLLHLCIGKLKQHHQRESNECDCRSSSMRLQYSLHNWLKSLLDQSPVSEHCGWTSALPFYQIDQVVLVTYQENPPSEEGVEFNLKSWGFGWWSSNFNILGDANATLGWAYED